MSGSHRLSIREGKTMGESSGNGVVFVTFALILILLLVVGGVGFYYLMERQKMLAAAAADQARMEEERAMVAKLEAERTRAEVIRVAKLPNEARASESLAADAGGVRAAVKAVLNAQEDAWNRGDVDAFMQHYWKSDDLTFSSGGQTTRGWQ